MMANEAIDTARHEADDPVDFEKEWFVEKAELRRVLEEINREIGFVPVSGATTERIRQMMTEDGIRPEDNVFSRGIIAARDEE